jgi:hypothetical protein
MKFDGTCSTHFIQVDRPGVALVLGCALRGKLCGCMEASFSTKLRMQVEPHFMWRCQGDSFQFSKIKNQRTFESPLIKG